MLIFHYAIAMVVYQRVTKWLLMLLGVINRITEDRDIPRYQPSSTIYTLRRCGWLMIDQHVLACSPKTGLLFLHFFWVWVGWGTNVQVHMHTYLMLRYGCVVLHLHIYSMPVQTSESALAHILDDMFPLYQILVIVV